VSPERVFHLAAVSTAREAAADSEHSRRVNVDSVEALCDWVKRDAPQARVVVLSSAAIFGQSYMPQSEETQCNPQDEYGRQKLRVRELAADARRSGSYVACAIPFNHESPRRDERFVFAKVCYGAARIKRGQQDRLTLGNLDVRRDWGYAPEYCTALAWMLEADAPHELVLATGEAHSVRELCAAAFLRAGVEDWEARVHSDFMLHRSADFDLQGDASRAAQLLDWRATTKFQQLVELLVDHALALES
jgi:GDPmannose 4,6-dehydratase